MGQMIHILGIRDRACQRAVTGLAKMEFIEWDKKTKITKTGREYLMERKMLLKVM